MINPNNPVAEALQCAFNRRQEADSNTLSVDDQAQLGVLGAALSEGSFLDTLYREGEPEVPPKQLDNTEPATAGRDITNDQTERLLKPVA